jgi:polar amino acid transport system permease protein
MGLAPSVIFLRITLPQATWRSLPSAVNQAINTFKLTSLASFISVHELFFSVGDAIQGSQRPLEAYTIMAAMYLVAVGIGTIGSSAIERRMRRRFGSANV